MTRWRRILPHPFMTVTIFVVWPLLWQQASALLAGSGAVLAVVIPYATRDLWPDAPVRVRPWALARFAVTVAFDILTASLAVARLALVEGHRVQPGWVTVPIEIDDPFVVAILTSTISLTPGTLSAALDSERRVVEVHCLHLTDPPDEVARHIKGRYERALKEAFRC